MNCIQFLSCVALVLQVVWATPIAHRQLKCEPLKIKMCQQLNYNQTFFPNFANHRSQWEAMQTIRSILPLLNSGCSADLVHLTCAYYAPVCTSYDIMVRPCRSLCKRVKKDCTPAMKKIYGRTVWPKGWNCKKLPKRKRNAVCFGRPSAKQSNNSVALSQ